MNWSVVTVVIKYLFFLTWFEVDQTISRGYDVLLLWYWVEKKLGFLFCGRWEVCSRWVEQASSYRLSLIAFSTSHSIICNFPSHIFHSLVYRLLLHTLWLIGVDIIIKVWRWWVSLFVWWSTITMCGGYVNDWLIRDLWMHVFILLLLLWSSLV